MSPRALAVFTAIASATWLFPFLTGCAAEPAPGGPVHLRYVTHKARPASDYKRVAEYFTSKPENGDDVVLPSDATSRAGHWFTFALGGGDRLPVGTVATLEVVRTDSASPRRYTFAIPAPATAAFTRDFHLGLTGKDALPAGARVTAWKLTLADATAHPLASATSYLWEMPVK